MKEDAERTVSLQELSKDGMMAREQFPKGDLHMEIREMVRHSQAKEGNQTALAGASEQYTNTGDKGACSL